MIVIIDPNNEKGGLEMYKYIVSYMYSRDGQKWLTTCKTVKAESQRDAMNMVSSMYPHVRIKSATKVGNA